MNRAFLLPVLCCFGGLLIASGCSQAPWDWGKPAPGPTADAGAVRGSGLAAFPGNGKSDAKTPKNPLALARLSERQGQSEQAERQYQDLIKKSPKNPAPYHRLGVMYAKQGKIPQAEEHFSRALALKPDAPEVLSDAGYFYYLTGRAPEAERCLRRALEIDPGNKKYCTNLALAVGEQGRGDEAYDLFRRSATSETQATANMAFVLTQRGEYQQALNLYDRVLTEDPSMHVAADAMIELSKHTTVKGKDGPSAAPGEGRPVLASHQENSRSLGDIGSSSPASASSSLVTVGEGRPVLPALAANRYPVTAAEENVGHVSNVPADQRHVGNVPHTVAAGVPCAYALPSDVAAPQRAESPASSRSGLVPMPPASSATAALSPPDLPPSKSASETPTRVSPGSLSIKLLEPLTLTLIGGMVLMGVGAAAWLRRGPRRRSSVASLKSVSSAHRPGGGLTRDRRGGVRIRPVRGALRRSRA